MALKSRWTDEQTGAVHANAYHRVLSVAVGPQMVDFWAGGPDAVTVVTVGVYVTEAARNAGKDPIVKTQFYSRYVEPDVDESVVGLDDHATFFETTLPNPTRYTVHVLDRPGDGPSRRQTVTVQEVDSDRPVDADGMNPLKAAYLMLKDHPEYSNTMDV